MNEAFPVSVLSRGCDIHCSVPERVSLINEHAEIGHCPLEQCTTRVFAPINFSAPDHSRNSHNCYLKPLLTSHFVDASSDRRRISWASDHRTFTLPFPCINQSIEFDPSHVGREGMITVIITHPLRQLWSSLVSFFPAVHPIKWHCLRVIAYVSVHFPFHSILSVFPAPLIAYIRVTVILHLPLNSVYKRLRSKIAP